MLLLELYRDKPSLALCTTELAGRYHEIYTAVILNWRGTRLG